MSPLHFIVPGHPRPKGRHRCMCINGRPRTRTPKETLAYEARVKNAARTAATAARWTPLHGPVRLTVHVWFASKTRGDLSNVVKAIEDAMNGVAYVDDKQISTLRETRYGIDADRPRVEVWVCPDERLMVTEVDTETGEMTSRLALDIARASAAAGDDEALRIFALHQVASGDFGEATELARVALGWCA